MLALAFGWIAIREKEVSAYKRVFATLPTATRELELRATRVAQMIAMYNRVPNAPHELIEKLREYLVSARAPACAYIAEHLEGFSGADATIFMSAQWDYDRVLHIVTTVERGRMTRRQADVQIPILNEFFIISQHADNALRVLAGLKHADYPKIVADSVKAVVRRIVEFKADESGEEHPF